LYDHTPILLATRAITIPVRKNRTYTLTKPPTPPTLIQSH
jgi:hypothetical protein